MDRLIARFGSSTDRKILRSADRTSAHRRIARPSITPPAVDCRQMDARFARPTHRCCRGAGTRILPRRLHRHLGKLRISIRPQRQSRRTLRFRRPLQIARTHEYFAAFNTFVADPVQQQAFFAHWQPGLILRLGLWANAHHLFPQTWLEGFLFTYGTSPGRATFLLGTYSMVGRWSYFPVAMLVKTPLATLVALLGVAVYWIFVRGTRLIAWNCIAFFLVPVVYLAVAVSSDLNLGIRHVLPVYPFLFIAIGVTAADAVRRFHKPAIIAIAIVLIGLAAESLSAYPDYIPFFSVAFGGWREGPNLLGDSNVDWGQDLPALAAWQQDHPRNQLFLGYFGSADPRYYQIHYIKLPGGQGPDDESPQNWRTPVYAISGNTFQNPWLTAEQKEFYANLWWRQKPIAVLGHCIYLYNAP